MRNKFVLSFFAASAALLSGTTQASLITNGSFELTTNGVNKQLAASPTTASNRTTLVGWTSTNGNDGGYNFVLDGTNKSGLTLKSANNGFSNAPDGGNFFASDPQYYPGYLYQLVTGLDVGSKYTLTFDYALAQQNGFGGANNNAYWQVGFDNVIQNTAALSIPEGGFSGWKSATMVFTATSTSEVLSFLAKGGTAGAPPFMLLDGVALNGVVPEPPSWSILLGGLGLMGVVARRRRTLGAKRG